MRVVLTTVKEAKCLIDNKEVSTIGYGYLLLVGFTHSDTKAVVDKMINKILSLRVFPDKDGNTNLSIYDVDGDIMSISQFTLYGEVKEGRRPSFIKAMKYEQAELLYNYFNKELETKYGKEIKTGVFGANMDIRSANSGPFTLCLDSEDL